ncbi:GtrA family protein [Candidatus Phycosocius spiralis]|nr:GtrA family protein [Candidatus Phycosocius spiralis]
MMRFIIVGGLGFGLDAALVFGLLHLGFNVYVCRVVSLCAVLGFTYLLNRMATFVAAGPPSWREFLAYVVASLLALGVNYGVFVGALWLHAPVLLAMMAGTGLAAVLNFLSYGRIFKAAKPHL